jgi:hypothetical protein
VVEIRSYQLRPGSGAAFDDLARHRSVPMVVAWGMDVVAFGPSLHDPDVYYLVRAFDSVEHLQASQDAFYATDAWREGPREAILALIESSANVVLRLDEAAIEELRTSHHRRAE